MERSHDHGTSLIHDRPWLSMIHPILTLSMRLALWNAGSHESPSIKQGEHSTGESTVVGVHRIFVTWMGGHMTNMSMCHDQWIYCRCLSVSVPLEKTWPNNDGKSAKSWEQCTNNPQAAREPRIDMKSVNKAVTNFVCQASWDAHWIGSRENLQETMVFTIKYRAFRLKIAHHPILWDAGLQPYPDAESHRNPSRPVEFAPDKYGSTNVTIASANIIWILGIGGYMALNLHSVYIIVTGLLCIHHA